MNRFPEITMTGSPYERGLQYGRACRREIAVSLDSYRWRFQHSKQLSWERACKLARRFLPAIRQVSEDYVSEMQGIADGAGVTLDDILAINVRSELLYTSLPKEEEGECTAFTVMPPATADGMVVAGQNWDYAITQREAVVILRFPDEGDRPAMVFLTEAGMIGGMGMNTAGLSLTLNALSVRTGGEGIPLRIRMRRILECRTLADAYDQAIRGSIPSAANLIITHRDGVALGLELDPCGVEVLLPRQGALVHTNHFVGPAGSLRNGSASGASTYIRFQRATQLFCGRSGITVEDIKEALRDHKGYPTSICAHPRTPEPYTAGVGATNFGLIMDLTHGTMEVAVGNPCSAPFAVVSLEAEA